MKLRDAIDPGLVFLELEARDGEAALAAVSEQLDGPTGLDAATILAALRDREALGSTSVGNGYAIPHCKLATLDEIVVALARMTDGVGFDDGKSHPPVRFFFVVLSPPDRPTEHLQVLSQIARILKNEELRTALMEAPGESAVISAIHRAAEQEGL
ncbi:MAG: PTS sugar transporter subunit IIA [Thermoanaerobaculales bacterium]|jgi:mannitol/fructose-specific phosphotransferase system IIA component (Ntr-type)|nr:PTS sugar transporter subunit IIA [Thermoanaerobaculales bacterium]